MLQVFAVAYNHKSFRFSAARLAMTVPQDLGGLVLRSDGGHMPLKNKLALSIGLLGLLCLLLPGPLRADTIYSYTGNSYSSSGCSPSPCISPSNLSGSFTVGVALAANLSNFFFTPSAFSFTDGSFPALTGASTLAVSTFQVGTDQNANIVSWGIHLATSNSVLSGCGVNGALIGSFNNPIPPNGDGASGDFSCFLANQNTPSQAFSFGSNSGNPGTWTVSTTTTPEPSSLLLLGTGLLAVMGITWRKKQSC
jgi:PEP-CTERM motif